MKQGIVFLFFLMMTCCMVRSQVASHLQGQMAGWALYNESNSAAFNMGGLFIPQLNSELAVGKRSKLDIEASAKFDGTTGIEKWQAVEPSFNAKPYRVWARLSSSQWEARVGLQKINFGSAIMLRPLMWFDKVDPRDPLQLTDGVWGGLGRYYFLNNANVWLWALYGNKESKTWELGETNQSIPEMGGRVQLPMPNGEVAVSYHFRRCDVMGPTGSWVLQNSPENRLGLDAKWDVTIGLWTEATWLHKSDNIGIYTNQQLLTIGADYTWAVGNGINVVGEHMMGAYGEKAFVADDAFQFTAFSVSYPLGMFMDLSVMVYSDWDSGSLYNFVNLKRTFGNLTAYFIAFKNPDVMMLPSQLAEKNLFGGTGCQLMAVYNF